MHAPPNPASRWRGIAARLGLVAMGLLLALAVLEIALRIAGGAAVLRDSIALPSADSIVVLCVGDSHTWGNGLGVPARLAERLAERSPRYRVINLGVPGANTAQLRKRFEGYIEYFDPALIVFWAGLNNVWNRTGTAGWADVGAGEPSLWRRLLDEIRILRFVRVWRQQAALRDILDAGGAYVKPELEREDTALRKTRKQRLGTTENTFVNQWAEDGSYVDREWLVRATAGDIAWMIERARERGIPVLPITYPHESGEFLPVNAGIRWAARETGTPVVSGLEAKKALSERWKSEGRQRLRMFDETAHPVQPLYGEVADRTLDTIDAHGLLPLP